MKVTKSLKVISAAGNASRANTSIDPGFPVADMISEGHTRSSVTSVLPSY